VGIYYPWIRSRRGCMRGARTCCTTTAPGAICLCVARVTRAQEPKLECLAALLSPGTDMVDGHAFIQVLPGVLENAAGLLVLDSPLANARYAPDAIYFEAEIGSCISVCTGVNAAGLHAPNLALRFAGLDPTHLRVWPVVSPLARMRGTCLASEALTLNNQHAYGHESLRKAAAWAKMKCPPTCLPWLASRRCFLL